MILVLDVSPSMRLVDAGPDRKQARRARSASVLESLFQRVPIEQYLLSVVAVYNGAKPVVVGTKDMEVVRNILADLPMQYAFKVGKTDLFSGIAEADRVARPWKPRSTLLILVSDGDTVPPTGMPKLPASIQDVLVVGVGDPPRGELHRRPPVAAGRRVAPPDRRPIERDLLRRQREAPAVGPPVPLDCDPPGLACFRAN